MRRLFGPWTLRIFAAVLSVTILGALVLHNREPRLPENLSDDTIVAVLGSASTPYPAELRLAAGKLRAAPGDEAAALRAARLYLD